MRANVIHGISRLLYNQTVQRSLCETDEELRITRRVWPEKPRIVVFGAMDPILACVADLFDISVADASVAGVAGELAIIDSSMLSNLATEERLMANFDFIVTDTKWHTHSQVDPRLVMHIQTGRLPKKVPYYAVPAPIDAKMSYTQQNLRFGEINCGLWGTTNYIKKCLEMVQ